MDSAIYRLRIVARKNVIQTEVQRRAHPLHRRDVWDLMIEQLMLMRGRKVQLRLLRISSTQYICYPQSPVLSETLT